MPGCFMSHSHCSSSRCYVYHAPIAFAKNSKLPAQVRMMRSWGLAAGTEKDKGSELGYSFDKGVSHWADAAGQEAERKFFPANQPEVNGDGDFSENSLGMILWSLRNGIRSANCQGAGLSTHSADCRGRSDLMGGILMASHRKKIFRKISWVRKRSANLQVSSWSERG